MKEYKKKQNEAKKAESEAIELEKQRLEARKKLYVVQTAFENAKFQALEINKKLSEEEEILKGLKDSDPVQELIKAYTEKSTENEPIPVPVKAKEECALRHKANIEETEEEVELLKKQHESLKLEIDKLTKTTKTLQTKYDELEKKTNEAYEKAFLLSKEAIEETDKFVSQTKKWFRMLSWDGVHNNNGSCNSFTDDAAKTKGQELRDKMEKARSSITKLKGSLINSPKNTKAISATIRHGDSVSVRIIECGEKFKPIMARCPVKIQLKRIYLIKSLLFRVYDKNDACVYQEILNAEKIDQLPAVLKNADITNPNIAAVKNSLVPEEERIGSGMDANQKKQTFITRVDGVRTYADSAASPYKFRVWVSTQADTFDGIAVTKDPVNAHGVTVDDQFIRSKSGLDSKKRQKVDDQKKKFQKDVIKRNQCRATNVRIITIAMPLVKTSPNKTTHYNKSDAQKHTWIFNTITAVNQMINPNSYIPRAKEQRIFINPEWYFQHEKTVPYALSETAKNTIIDNFNNSSDLDPNKNWLILPGSILWKKAIQDGKNKNSGASGVVNTMPIAYSGDHRLYHKKKWGSDTPMRPSSIDIERSGKLNSWKFGKRRTSLNKGNMPSSLKPALIAAKILFQNSNITITQVTTDVAWGMQIDAKHYIIYKPKKKILRIMPRELYIPTMTDKQITNCVFSKMRKSDYVKRNCFSYNTLKLGVEICRDHRDDGAVLQDYDDADGTGTGDKKGLDIHIIPTCDVNPASWRTAARDGGLVVYCEGKDKNIKTVWRIQRTLPILDAGATKGTKQEAVDLFTLYKALLAKRVTYNDFMQHKKIAEARLSLGVTTEAITTYTDVNNVRIFRVLLPEAQ